MSTRIHCSLDEVQCIARFALHNALPVYCWLAHDHKRRYYPHDTIGNALVASQLVLKLAKEIEEDDVDENSVSIVWQGDRVVLHTVP
eukprot:m.187186 g.187186  ORF g.187186 m.187186 type:complete len:87 (+) comp18499_c0_seq5:1101-1361(+)